MGNRSTDSRAHEKQDQARELRLNGYTFAQIAASHDPTAPVGLARPLYASPGAAKNAYEAACKRHDAAEHEKQVDAETQRRLLWDRYEMVIQTHMPDVIGGKDVDASRMVIAAMKAQAQLYGLNRRPPYAVPENETREVDPADDIARKRAERIARGAVGGAAPAGSPPSG